jgi:hypothetical protein
MVIMLGIQGLQQVLLSATMGQGPMMVLGVRINLNQHIFIYKWSIVPCNVFYFFLFSTHVNKNLQAHSLIIVHYVIFTKCRCCGFKGLFARCLNHIIILTKNWHGICFAK